MKRIKTKLIDIIQMENILEIILAFIAIAFAIQHTYELHQIEVLLLTK